LSKPRFSGGFPPTWPPRAVKKPKAFNPDQLATWAQATQYAKLINASAPFQAAGISIPKQDPPNSGIYIPAWGNTGGAEPSGPGGLVWLHYRFSNGMSGVNVGLVIAEFARYPAAPLYVEQWLLAQVQSGLKRLKKAA